MKLFGSQGNAENCAGLCWKPYKSLGSRDEDEDMKSPYLIILTGISTNSSLTPIGFNQK